LVNIWSRFQFISAMAARLSLSIAYSPSCNGARPANRHGILSFGACSMPVLPIAVPSEQIAEFCRRNQIRKLSFFGAVISPRFRAESDVDMLVAFEADARPTLLTMARLERELSDLLHRKVDLRTANELSRYFRSEVVAAAVPHYDRSAPNSSLDNLGSC
jgi:uncharacterized protein